MPVPNKWKLKSLKGLLRRYSGGPIASVTGSSSAEAQLLSPVSAVCAGVQLMDCSTPVVGAAEASNSSAAGPGSAALFMWCRFCAVDAFLHLLDTDTVKRRLSFGGAFRGGSIKRSRPTAASVGGRDVCG